MKTDDYDKLPSKKGLKYIIRSKCCLAKVYSGKLICGECEKMPCQPITFIESPKK
jgi:hypothetical protein